MLALCVSDPIQGPGSACSEGFDILSCDWTSVFSEQAAPQYFVGVRFGGQRIVGVREAHRNKFAIAASKRAFRRAGIVMAPIRTSDRYSR
jgi:hypothetical protein